MVETYNESNIIGIVFNVGKSSNWKITGVDLLSEIVYMESLSTRAFGKENRLEDVLRYLNKGIYNVVSQETKATSNINNNYLIF